MSSPSNKGWRFFISNKLLKLEFNLEKVLGFRNMWQKLENAIYNSNELLFEQKMQKIS